MSAPGVSAAGSMPIRVRNIRDALDREFRELIDMTDISDPGRVDGLFYTRALAALAVRSVLGCDSAAAAQCVIDGRHDQGIDAIAVVDGQARVLLVQSKWSDKGTAGLDTHAARALIDGFRIIDRGDADRFNARGRPLAEQVQAVLHDPKFQVTLVVALMGTNDLHPDVARVLDDGAAEFNGHGPVLDYQVLRAADFYRIVRDHAADPPVHVSATVEQWLRLAGPPEAVFGTVAVGELAAWHDEFGGRLFSRNIRKSLGLTETNREMVNTLAVAPEDFLYRNNGIMVLCDAFEVHPRARGSRNGPLDVHLRGASVVNGAQTVSAIAEAVRQHPDAADAYVHVRIISTGDGGDDFATAVTEATNRQNRVENRDFAALDPVQAEIAVDFTLSLQKTYVYKRGETDPPPSAGCSMVHAATALACSYRSADLVARIKNDPDLLWERGAKGAYRLLFGERPTAHRIWRTVETVRRVGERLHSGRRGRSGRLAQIADHGDLLITHVVFRFLATLDIDDPDVNWDSVLAAVPGTTDDALMWLNHHVDNEYGPKSFVTTTFRDAERCRLLAELILDSLRRGTAAPEPLVAATLHAKRRKPRTQNAVITIVDSGSLPDATPLTFLTAHRSEDAALGPWLAEDPKRGTAAWINERSQPLLWAADGRRYTPSGLVMHIWDLAHWEGAHVSVQGPARWQAGDRGTLAQIADQIRRSRSDEDEAQADADTPNGRGENNLRRHEPELVAVVKLSGNSNEDAWAQGTWDAKVAVCRAAGITDLTQVAKTAVTWRDNNHTLVVTAADGRRYAARLILVEGPGLPANLSLGTVYPDSPDWPSFI